jgi:hypothetical protein
MAKLSNDAELGALLDRIEEIAHSAPGTHEHDELLARVDVLHRFLVLWWEVIYGQTLS